MTHSPRLLISAGLAFLTMSQAAADQVRLRNGDQLTGSIVRADEKTIVLKTGYAGEIKIDRAVVTSLSADTPLSLELKDGQKVVGTVETRGSEVRVATADTGTVTTTLDRVAAVRNKEEQAAYEQQIERYRNPGLLDLWTGYVDTGMALARGNSKSQTINTAVVAERATSRDKIAVSFTQLFSRTTTQGANVTAANAIRGGLRYNLDITRKLLAFGFTELEYDEFQALDLRFVIGGGLGYHIFKNERGFWDLGLGANSNREFFATGLRRTSAELLLAEESSYALPGGSKFAQRLAFYPNISNTGAYRINFDAGTVTKLNTWMDWQVTVSDRYLSNPIFGRKKNDIIFTTGLRLNFKR